MSIACNRIIKKKLYLARVNKSLKWRWAKQIYFFFSSPYCLLHTQRAHEKEQTGDTRAAIVVMLDLCTSKLDVYAPASMFGIMHNHKRKFVLRSTHFRGLNSALCYEAFMICLLQTIDFDSWIMILVWYQEINSIISL